MVGASIFKSKSEKESNRHQSQQRKEIKVLRVDKIISFIYFYYHQISCASEVGGFYGSNQQLQLLGISKVNIFLSISLAHPPLLLFLLFSSDITCSVLYLIAGREALIIWTLLTINNENIEMRP